MTKTIKERAEEYATQYNGNIDQSEYNAYYDGATDQRNIDFEKACAWFVDRFGDFETKSFISKLVEELKQAMEE